MRKLSELKADEFIDVSLIFIQILPAIKDFDLGEVYIEGKTDQEKGIALITEICTKLLPVILGKEHRKCIYEILSILEEKTIDEIKEYKGGKLISCVKNAFSGGEIANFFQYAEESE